MININFFRTPKDIEEDLVKRVKARRKDKKITQMQLAKMADVSLGSIRRFERTGEISLVSLIRISFALGCSEDFDGLFAKRTYSSIEEMMNEKE